MRCRPYTRTVDVSLWPWPLTLEVTAIVGHTRLVTVPSANFGDTRLFVFDLWAIGPTRLRLSLDLATCACGWCESSSFIRRPSLKFVGLAIRKIWRTMHSLANRHSCSTPAETQYRKCFSMQLILVVGKVNMINQICQMLSFCWKLLSAYFAEKKNDY